MNPKQHKAPVLFVSHGAPTFALEPGRLGGQLRALGQQLAGVKAVLVVSPHWQTRDVKVMSTAMPETVHDFGGFAPALYELHYPAAGAPDLAAQTAQLLGQAGLQVSMEERRGLDHGAWVPLWHLLPDAKLPVFQVSMPLSLDTHSAYQLGQALAGVRELGVMILASGSMTHNLYEFRQGATQPEDYAIEFTHWVRQSVSSHDQERMLNYRQLAPHAQRAHPTDEHFLPLLIAMGARGEADELRVLDGGITNGMLSMESYAWGLSEQEVAA